MVVKTADGTEHTFHFIGRTVAHGAEATAGGSKDAFLGMKEGDEVVVHYTEKGAVKTAQEVDHIGKDGLKMSVVAVKSVDHGAKTVTVKTAEGAEETYHLTDNALRETGKGLDKAGKVTVYYPKKAARRSRTFSRVKSTRVKSSSLSSRLRIAGGRCACSPFCQPDGWKFLPLSMMYCLAMRDRTKRRRSEVSTEQQTEPKTQSFSKRVPGDFVRGGSG